MLFVQIIFKHIAWARLIEVPGKQSFVIGHDFSIGWTLLLLAMCIHIYIYIITVYIHNYIYIYVYVYTL